MTINSENYVDHVLRTDCPITPELQARMTNPGTIRLLHAAMGLATESAELVDMLKKHIFYGKQLDLVNAEEEGGDVLWYIGLLVDELGKTFNEVMTKNISKLRLRYPEKFKDVDAINRNVEAERNLLERSPHAVDNLPEEKEMKPAICYLKDNGKVFELLPLSQRGYDFCMFAARVLEHIETYTVPQYGDKGEDQATNYDAAAHMLQVKRYHARFGTNARLGEELRDLLKMAHYTQMAHDALKGA